MGGDGAFKKVAKSRQRTYKERGQPAARAKSGAGLLEKHKDYVLRARAYHDKEKRIKSLQEKARFRNPDEFYFKMINTKTKDGVHASSPGARRAESLDMDTAKLLKTQDANYITSRATMEAKKVARLQSTLHLVDADVDAATAAPKHIVFVEDGDAARQFDAAKHFDTVPELVDRPANRLRRRQLQDAPIATAPMDVEAVEGGREQAYKELAARMDRAEKLHDAAEELNLQRQLMGKGQRRKVGKDARGLPVYKWAQERKR